MTPTIEIKNSKELPILTWAPRERGAHDEMEEYIDKFGRAPSVRFKLGYMIFYAVDMVCPSCYVRVNKFGPCQACADG